MPQPYFAFKGVYDVCCSRYCRIDRRSVYVDRNRWWMGWSDNWRCCFCFAGSTLWIKEENNTGMDIKSFEFVRGEKSYGLEC